MWILSKVDSIKYFRVCALVMAASIVGLMLAGSEVAILILIGIVGLSCSSIFPVILYAAMEDMPQRSNEVSGLMITAICGGAIVSPAMSYAVKICGGNHIGALAVLLFCASYLCAVAFGLKVRKA